MTSLKFGISFSYFKKNTIIQNNLHNRMNSSAATTHMERREATFLVPPASPLSASTRCLQALSLLYFLPVGLCIHSVCLFDGMSIPLFAYHFCCGMWAIFSIWLLGAMLGLSPVTHSPLVSVDLFLVSRDSVSEEADNGSTHSGFLPLPMSSVCFCLFVFK